jgi:hypothetical protein
MEEWESASEKAARYIKMAQVAEGLASKAKSSETREAYLKLACGWRELAAAAERTRQFSN